MPTNASVVDVKLAIQDVHLKDLASVEAFIQGEANNGFLEWADAFPLGVGSENQTLDLKDWPTNKNLKSKSQIKSIYKRCSYLPLVVSILPRQEIPSSLLMKPKELSKNSWVPLTMKAVITPSPAPQRAGMMNRGISLTHANGPSAS